MIGPGRPAGDRTRAAVASAARVIPTTRPRRSHAPRKGPPAIGPEPKSPDWSGRVREGWCGPSRVGAGRERDCGEPGRAMHLGEGPPPWARGPTGVRRHPARPSRAPPWAGGGKGGGCGGEPGRAGGEPLGAARAPSRPCTDARPPAPFQGEVGGPAGSRPRRSTRDATRRRADDWPASSFPRGDGRLHQATRALARPGTSLAPPGATS